MGVAARKFFQFAENGLGSRIRRPAYTEGDQCFLQIETHFLSTQHVFLEITDGIHDRLRQEMDGIRNTSEDFDGVQDER